MGLLGEEEATVVVDDDVVVIDDVVVVDNDVVVVDDDVVVLNGCTTGCGCYGRRRPMLLLLEMMQLL